MGAEQSGFMEDLGYETYQKILSQAVTELRNDEFSELYEQRAVEAGSDMSFVEDCTIESDLEMYFPEPYVPGSSERIWLYRELDNIEDDAELDAYRQRLIDRLSDSARGRRADAGCCSASTEQTVGLRKDCAQTRANDDAVC